MLIGQATLKSAAFCPRLTMLVKDLQAAGYTVWLEGMDVRFDCTSAVHTRAQAADIGALMRRYRDIVYWVPEPKAALAEAALPAGFGARQPDAPPGTPPTAPRWKPPFFRRGPGVNPNA